MAGVLRASFVRARGQRDRIHVRRSDRTETSWAFPTYGDGLPHDLVHLVVEAAFGVRGGFWGRVDAGADPARINEEASRDGAGYDRGFGGDSRDILLAEGLASAHWFDRGIDDAACCDALAEHCAGFGVALPRTVTPERVAAARGALERLRARWRSFEEGTLTLLFRSDDPDAGFAEMIVDE